MKMREPEHVAEDGTVRKDHYGAGRQPWDDILDAGWGPAFAAGNALKYVKRHAAKNGEDDLEKGRWYYARLQEFLRGKVGDSEDASLARTYHDQLVRFLTVEEHDLLCH